MPYIMEIYIDGGCRGNGRPGSIGAAAAVFKNERGSIGRVWTQSLPSRPRPTNQRAELTALVLALEKARERYFSLNGSPEVDITIYSDSRYVVGCMSSWVHKWEGNGWTNSRGQTITNADLIQNANFLTQDMEQMGEVKYIWIPREENEDADRYCNEELDKQSN